MPDVVCRHTQDGKEMTTYLEGQDAFVSCAVFAARNISLNEVSKLLLTHQGSSVNKGNEFHRKIY